MGRGKRDWTSAIYAAQIGHLKARPVEPRPGGNHSWPEPWATVACSGTNGFKNIELGGVSRIERQRKQCWLARSGEIRKCRRQLNEGRMQTARVTKLEERTDLNALFFFQENL